MARANIILGPIYWKNPKVEYLILLAAAVKHSRGAVVTMPAHNNSTFILEGNALKLVLTCANHIARPFVKTVVSAVDGKLMVQSIPQKGFMNDDIPPPSPMREFGIFDADRIIDMNGTQQAEFIRNEDGSIGWLRMSRILVKQ